MGVGRLDERRLRGGVGGLRFDAPRLERGPGFWERMLVSFRFGHRRLLNRTPCGRLGFRRVDKATGLPGTLGLGVYDHVGHVRLRLTNVVLQAARELVGGPQRAVGAGGHRDKYDQSGIGVQQPEFAR